MSYKNDVLIKIKNIIAQDEDIESEIEKFIKNDYKRLIEDYKKTGQSIEGITYEMLEGIEDGLQNSTKQSKEILKNSSKILIDTAKESAKESVEESFNLINKHKEEFNKELNNIDNNLNKINILFKKDLEKAYRQFYENIEHEKSHLLEVINGISIYSKDKSYNFFEESLKKGKDGINFIDNFTKKYKRSVHRYLKIKIAVLFYKLANRINKI